ncbi:DUF6283 family protein [Streptomyces zhihengii]
MHGVPVRGPAPRPCESCPYRRDVPSGIWAHEEYAKLIRYDDPTGVQPSGLFQCHQTDGGSAARRVCAGWAGCHGPELLAPRTALAFGRIDADTFAEIVNYQSPVPLFDSGMQAAQHGQANITRPDDNAQRQIDKITRTRGDLTPACRPQPPLRHAL